MSNLSDNLEEIAQQPQSVSVDGQSVSQRPIGDLIAADKYRRATQANRDATLGLRIRRIKLPGAS